MAFKGIGQITNSTHQKIKIMLDLIAEELRISKVFLEPHLVQKFGIKSDKFRYQGCRATKLDDHVHVQF